MRNAYKTLVEKPEGKRQFGRPRLRWEGNIAMDLKEVGWELVDCIHVAQNKGQWLSVVNTVMNLRVA
jgi:hypothetical protein